MNFDFDFDEHGTGSCFHKNNLDNDLGQFKSYGAYNAALLRLVDFDGKTPFDWYRNKENGEIIWLDGHAKIDNYANLGHMWGKTFANGDRLLLNGDTKLITYNGEILYNFKKKTPKLGGGYAFADGGFSQNPGALMRGGRYVTWIDFGGALFALIAILGFEVKGSTSKGKGTNGGKPTKDDKMNDKITAVDHSVNGGKEAKSLYDKAIKEIANDGKYQEEYEQTFNSKTQMYNFTRKDQIKKPK
ncbi:hypothetical protein [Flavobacterium hercynium]|uniref:Uncharacterized protein n=1 Tax=Flavobacterium hercynium TaxID=387094 RepID=A0A226H346_9FLAO|nr:hypothetical protein [Flavobacterium hercynium]OXA88697.1 hypothetical protein B0A66_14930 [Flavobacterium hercynium]SMP34440.1 hypothetical protein SAMN06265346_11817 [Flavobacterium hercynium]